MLRVVGSTARSTSGRGSSHLPYENVIVETSLGPAPAWFVPADDERRWVIQVHGRGVKRTEGLRAVKPAHEARVEHAAHLLPQRRRGARERRPQVRSRRHRVGRCRRGGAVRRGARSTRDRAHGLVDGRRDRAAGRAALGARRVSGSSASSSTRRRSTGSTSCASRAAHSACPARSATRVATARRPVQRRDSPAWRLRSVSRSSIRSFGPTSSTCRSCSCTASTTGSCPSTGHAGSRRRALISSSSRCSRAPVTRSSGITIRSAGARSSWLARTTRSEHSAARR